MLDLMTKKVLSTKKKRIIKTYGSDMIAEMYLDLMNVTEGKKRARLSQQENQAQIMENPQENNLSDYISGDESIFNSKASLSKNELKPKQQKINCKTGQRPKYDPNKLLEPIKVSISVIIFTKKYLDRLRSDEEIQQKSTRYSTALHYQIFDKPSCKKDKEKAEVSY